MKKLVNIFKNLEYYSEINNNSFVYNDSNNHNNKMINNLNVYTFGLFNIIKCNSFDFIVLKKKNKLYGKDSFFFSFNFNLYSQIFLKTIISLISNYMYGNNFKYFIQLRLNGMGYKLSLSQTLECLKFSLGFSNKLSNNFFKYNLSNVLVFKKSYKGVSFILRTQYFYKLRLYANLLCLLKKVDPYKHKGIYIKDMKLKKKRGKKKMFIF